MTEYYDRDELVDTTAILVREACAVEPARRGDYHSTFDAIMSRSLEAVRQDILKQTPPDFILSFREDRRAKRDHHDYLVSQDSAQEVVVENDAIRGLIERMEVAADEEDFDRALGLLHQALELEPSSSELWTRLAFLQQRRGANADALQAAKRASELNPEDPWTHAVLGMSLANCKRLPEAEEAYLAALRIDPRHILALTELAEIYEDAGNVSAALTLYERGRKMGSLGDSARARYGQLLQREGRESEAEEVLREGANDVANIRTRHALVDILDSNGRGDEGIELLTSVANRQGSWEPWADLGYYLSTRTDDLTCARWALETAIEAGADQPSLFGSLARVIIRGGGDAAEVEGVASELTNRFPDRAAVSSVAGMIHRDLGQDERAERVYRAAIEHEDGEFARVLLARLLQSKPNRRREAEQLLRDAVASAQGSEACGPAKELAELLIHDGEDVAANVVVQQALKANDRCFCCHVLRGEICTRKGDVDGAKNDFSAALEIDEDGISALTGLACIVDREEAEHLIARAIEADPNDPRCLLARARLRVGSVDAQIDDGNSTLALNPDYVEAHLFLAPLEAGRGNSETALKHLNSALSGLASQQELIPNFVSSAMAVAQRGHGEQLSRLLAEHESGSTVEPLAVALKLSRGERPMVAKEVLEVAKDIIGRASS
jgi:tetratricopeptide (TPR) repeat protein